MFKTSEFVTHRNTDIHDDISGIADPLMTKFPKTTAESITNHAKLRYDEIRVGNKGSCLNYNLILICHNANCYYQHTNATTTPERIKVVKENLHPTISSYIKKGVGPKKRRQATKA